jgi:hypothetical protein
MGGAACARLGRPLLIAMNPAATGDNSHDKDSVTEKAVVERIRQKLREQNSDLCFATPEKQKELKLGRYYTVGLGGCGF